MTAERCPDCEALMTELECLDCLLHTRHQNAVSVMGQRVATLAPSTSAYCPNGHLRTDENTRIDVRADGRQSISRACRTCHNEKAIRRRALRKAEAAT